MFFYLFKLFVIVFGIAWCVAIFKRWRSDLRDFREAQGGATRAVLVSYWALTALILFCVISFGSAFLSGIARLFLVLTG